ARPCPGLATLEPRRQAGGAVGALGDAYGDLIVDRALRTRAVALADYDYLHPSLSLTTTVAGGDGMGEVFDYPGGYLETAEGDRYARLRLEAADAQRETAEGTSGAPALTSGYTMAFVGHGPGAGGRSWLVTRVTHEARQGGLVAADSSGDGFSYGNRFTLASVDVPWRPPRRTPRPRVQGTQCALVTGNAGEEIWTDAHGRVTLHFYWDRHGTLDANSSCWVRCSTAWAGRGYGQFSVPRVGQEVLVDFLEGDPDRPVVVGRVFNADQPPPCDPGGSRGVVSGMRSKTHKGSGYNAMEMDDTTGKEKIAVHAQYDMITDVGHNDTQTVTNDRKITVKGKHTEDVTGDTAISITTGNYKHTVATGTGTFAVTGAVKETYGATQDTTVAGKISISSTGSEIAITAATKLSIVVGAATLTMNADGSIALNGKKLEIIGDTDIKVSAPTLAVTGGTKASLGVGNQQITCDTAKVNVSGAAINASAIGTHEITGALVKIN
ncbi:MAG TPA: type VI secretion system tip protein TssI/VgrG, partial [Gemmatirosa sp.]